VTKEKRFYKLVPDEVVGQKRPLPLPEVHEQPAEEVECDDHEQVSMLKIVLH